MILVWSRRATRETEKKAVQKVRELIVIAVAAAREAGYVGEEISEDVVVRLEELYPVQNAALSDVQGEAIVLVAEALALGTPVPVWAELVVAGIEF